MSISLLGLTIAYHYQYYDFIGEFDGLVALEYSDPGLSPEAFDFAETTQGEPIDFGPRFAAFKDVRTGKYGPVDFDNPLPGGYLANGHKIAEKSIAQTDHALFPDSRYPRDIWSQGRDYFSASLLMLYVLWLVLLPSMVLNCTLHMTSPPWLMSSRMGLGIVALVLQLVTVMVVDCVGGFYGYALVLRGVQLCLALGAVQTILGFVYTTRCYLRRKAGE